MSSARYLSSWHFLSSFCTYPLLFPFLHELHVSWTSLDQQTELTALWEVSQPNKTFYWWMLKVKAGKAEGTRSKAGSPLEISVGHTKSLRSVWLLMALGMSHSSCQSLTLSDRAEGWKALAWDWKLVWMEWSDTAGLESEQTQDSIALVQAQAVIKIPRYEHNSVLRFN